ncbi:hypothetical protein EYF80_015442 [Liparis tanakae]|uniref:Uncharacterized protein n=1 Tax=Liparis tanakae TaxID=230148 RepID=A0A4Z2I8H3_9TELE|nr:hypothetical protein EYF80_015442 [Liparis tanakae]
MPVHVVVVVVVVVIPLHMGLVSHGNLHWPIRSRRQLGLPSILPSLLSGPAMFLSAPLQRRPAPSPHNRSVSPGLHRAKLMGTLSLALGKVCAKFSDVFEIQPSNNSLGARATSSFSNTSTDKDEATTQNFY